MLFSNKKSQFSNLQVLQNKFIHACLFLSKSTNINHLLYEFNVLKINDLIRIDHAKFMFKYINNMLHHVFADYFTQLRQIIKALTNAKHVNCFYQLFLPTLFKKMISFAGIKHGLKFQKKSKKICFIVLNINTNYFSLATMPVTHKK